MDRRIRYTKKIIKEVVLNLLKEKEVNKITVSEICKLADINRATFYRYYLDVYDLISKIEEEFIDELKEIKVHDTSSVSNFSKELLEIFYEEKDLVKVLFNTNNNVYFLNSVIEIIHDACKTTWLRYNPNLNDKQIDIASLFIFNGALGIINYWIESDFEDSVEVVANIIEELSYKGIRKYLNITNN